MSTRKPWPRYFADEANLFKSQAECTRDQVACILFKGNRVVGRGINGAPAGWIHCTNGGCPRGVLSRDQCPAGSNYDNCISIHAEVNAILDAGHNARESSAVVTRKPCMNCAKTLVAAGVRLVYYPDAPDGVLPNLLVIEGLTRP